MTVHEALRSSTNLVFVRLMRDVVRYYMFQLPGSSAALLADADDPRRAEYLARFADREGKDFLAKLLEQVQGQDAARSRDAAAGQRAPDWPRRWLRSHRTVVPNATLAQFGAFIDAIGLGQQRDRSDDRIAETVRDQYAPRNMSLADRGYVSSVHPLELWLVGYLRTHPKADLDRSGRRPASRNARKSIRGCSRRTASTRRTTASPACSKSKPS